MLDPITREIMQHALAAAADEMALALYRTAYSTIVRDCLDYSTSLCNAAGEMIAQGVTIPLHLGSVPFAMATLFKKYGDQMDEGDIFILNDPFEGGMHIPDIFIIKPIFWEGQRVAFAVSTAHHLDMGGRLPGSSACDNTEIFQDGFRIPWLKLYRRGEPDEAIFALMRANVRVPQMTLGDVYAQISACHIGERAIHDLIRRYGFETFTTCATELIAYTERLVRAEIATWPDGEASFEDYMDSDGLNGPPVRIAVKLTKRGDSLTADFTGSAPQIRGAMNSTLSFTASVVALCVRAVLQQDIPNTAGMFKPLNIIAPAGTVLNCVMPAASSMRGVTGFRVTDVVFGALAGLLPERVLAAGEGGNTLVIIGGQKPDRSPYVYYELMSGTWGARPDRDGNDGLCNPANVASNIPIEQAECEYPVRIERYGYVQDSGGAGRFRGGLAIEREWTLLSGEAHLAIRSDRRAHLPYGLQGGGKGTPSINVLHHCETTGDGGRGTGEQGDKETGSQGSRGIVPSGVGHGTADEVLPTMISTTMTAGERIYHKQAGGGGFGNPLARDPQAVARDVRNEKVSARAAQELYGVAVNEAGEVDEEKTKELRAQIAHEKMIQTRRQWFEWYANKVTNESVITEPKDGTMYRCPCCHYRTLKSRGQWQICPVCFWEDDGQDDADADTVRGGPNRRLNLTQARKNYIAFGACDERSIKHVRPPKPEEKY